MLAMVGTVVLMASSASAFTWTIFGTADSGQWDGTNIAGRDYVLTFTAGSFAGQLGPSFYWGTTSAALDIQGLGTYQLGGGQVAQTGLTSTVPATDNLFAQPAEPSSIVNLDLPDGVLGNPTTLSAWGPVNAMFGSVVLHPLSTGWTLTDSVSSIITVCTRPGCGPGGQVPEPSTWLFLWLGLLTMAYAIRKAEPAYHF